MIVSESIAGLLRMKDRALESLQAQADRDIATIADLKAQIENAGWISVADRLPDDDCYVLGATWKTLSGDQHIDIVAYRSGSGRFTFDTVTHWMPLPAPPIAKVEGK